MSDWEAPAERWMQHAWGTRLHPVPSVCSAQTTLRASGSHHQKVAMLRVLGEGLDWFGILSWGRGGRDPGTLWVTLLPRVYLLSLRGCCLGECSPHLFPCCSLMGALGTLPFHSDPPAISIHKDQQSSHLAGTGHAFRSPLTPLSSGRKQCLQ